MESKTQSPSFTVSLRGYDRMEVDEYLDSLAEALGQVEEAEEVNRGLRNHIERLNARIADLEERISTDTPKTGAVLGERIAILLGSAEETATETIGRAEKQAAEMLDKAREEVEQAEDQARGAIVRGDEQARRIEAAARAEAAEIVSEAEARASARTRQIEQWAEQVVSHTRAEEARMLTEQQQKRDASEEELRRLAERRDAVAGTITELRAALGEALGLVGPPAALPAGPDPATRHVSLPVPELGVAAGGEQTDASAGTGAPDEIEEPTAVATEDPDPSSEMIAISGVIEAGEEMESVRVVDAAPAPSAPRSPESSAGQAAVDVDVDVDDVDEMPWPAAFRPFDSVDESDQTGEIELGGAAIAGADPDEFDSKFDAWVSGSEEGPRHFGKL